MKRISFSLLIAIIIFSSFCICTNMVLSEDSKIYLKVGIYENEPLGYTDKNGNIVGLYPELLTYISTMEDWNIEYINGNFEESLQRLKDKEIDILIGVAYSDERNKIYDFSNETIFSNWGQIYCREKEEIDSFLDLKGKKIVVLKDDIYYIGPNGIKSLVQKFDIDCTFIEVDEYKEAFRYIEDGKADLGVVNRLYGIKNKINYNINETSIVFSPIELRFAFPKDNPNNEFLINKIDQYMDSMKKNPDSFYYKTVAKYIEIHETDELTEVLPLWTKYVLIFIFILFVLIIAFLQILRSELKRKTKNLNETIKALEKEIEEEKELEKKSY